MSFALPSIPALATPATLILVDDNAVMKTRTAAQILSDIGAVSGSGTDKYLVRWNGTTGLSASLWYQDDAGVLGLGTVTPSVLVVGSTTIASALYAGLQIYNIDSGHHADLAINGAQGANIHLVDNSSSTGARYFSISTGGAATDVKDKTLFQSRSDNGGIQVNTSTGGPINPLLCLMHRSGLIGFGTKSPSSVLDAERVGSTANTTDFLELTNSGNAASMTATGTGILFNQFYYNAITPAVFSAARIAALTEGNPTATAATQNIALSFQTCAAGVLTEALHIDSYKNLTIGNIAALGSPATVFLTHTGGTIQSRTAAQVLSDIGAAAALSGTQNYLAKFTSATAIGNSQVFDDGTDVFTAKGLHVGAISGTAGDNNVLADGNITATGNTVGKEVYSKNSGTINKTSNNISSIAVTTGRTLTITRDGTTKLITSITDGTNTWTYTRDASNIVTSWALT
jgi:hypothetical protein